MVILIVFALLVFNSSSLAVISKAIRPGFNESTAATSAEMAAAEAIVLLGAGLYVNAPEYGEDTVSGFCAGTGALWRLSSPANR